jgi:hypothetical protein
VESRCDPGTFQVMQKKVFRSSVLIFLMVYHVSICVWHIVYDVTVVYV